MTNVTWRAGTGSWSNSLNWSTLSVPGANDTAVFDSPATSTATVVQPVVINTVNLVAGTDATLLLNSTLSLSGDLLLNGGTLDLAQGGVIKGGTLDVGAGKLVADGGVLDGVLVAGKLGGGVAITTATAALTAAANSGTLNVSDTLHLVAGTYDGLVLANAITPAPFDLVINPGTVTLGSAATIYFSLDDPRHVPGNYPATSQVSITGSGTLVNDGLIQSDISVAGLPLRIDVANFVNNGTLAVAPAVVAGETVPYTHMVGKQIQSGVLTWNATFQGTVEVSGTSFVNNGTLKGVSALVDVEASSFVNTGQIALADGTTQSPVLGPQYYISTVPLASSLKVGSASFSNTGTLSASTIEIDGNLTLAQLGTLVGHVVLAGTLDLQGGTLDISASPGTTFSFQGGISHGTLLTGGIPLDDAHATLSGVTVVRGILSDIATGPVTLDANTTNLEYSTAASIDGLQVTAGAAGITDRLVASANGTLTFGAATTISDTFAGSTLEIDGPGSFADNGRITIDAAALTVATTLDGSGTIAIADGASLAIADLAATDATTIAFGAGNNLLTLPGDASSLGALGLTLTGLHQGDVLDFTGLSANPSGPFAIGGATLNNGTLDISAASGQQASLTIEDAAGLSFVTSSDPTSGTLVTVACFRAGTAIAVPDGEVRVEALRIGDMVLTASGRLRPIRWIGRRAYPAETVAAQAQLRPVRVAAGALGRGLPRRDLYLSPLHALLLDGVLVPAAALVNGTTITRAPLAAVSYFHIELDSGDIILAEGAATETFVDCDSRAMFHNADEYHRLYPGAAPPKWQFATRRVEQGWELQAIHARLAGLAPAASAGRLRGHIDRQADGLIEGWAMDSDDPALPVEFELVAHGRQVGCLIANRYRIDLDRAQIGRATHAFVAELPELDAATLAAVTLHRFSDGATLAP